MPSGVPTVSVQIKSDAKPWWTSKTLWLNAIVLGLAAAEAHLNILQPLVPVDVYGIVAFLLPIANAALRFITTQGLALGKSAAITQDAAGAAQ